MDIIKLNYYIPKKQDIIGYTSGIRPCRLGGIRIERQNIQDKIVFHNYGHGGGGLTLAYGTCSELIAKYFNQLNYPKDRQIAVIGAGVVGLTSAFLLMQQGYKVNIYADIYPLDKNEYKPQLTSTVAAGQWLPFKVGHKQLNNMSIKSWNHYKNLYQQQIKQGKKYGISKTKTYVINDDQSCVFIQGIMHPKDCLIDFGDGNLLKAKTFNTYIIEGEFYCSYLIQKLKKSKRVRFNRVKFNDFADVKKLQQTVIFNCLGLLSYKIFIDQFNMEPVKGHLVRFKYQKNVENHILYIKLDEDNYIFQVPHPQGERLNLGITFEKNKLNPFPQKEQIQKIFKNSKNYFESIQKEKIKAKL